MTNDRYGLPAASPESAGFSGDRLTRIGDAVQRYIDSRILPGALTVIARHGSTVHFLAQGMRDIAEGKPVEEDTIFRMASMTKPILCTGLMMLYEEGLFRLDQPVSDFLPSFKEMLVRGKHDFPEPARREITVKDCLSHTAGFSATEWDRVRSRLAPQPVPLIPTSKEKINQPALEGTLAEAVELLSGTLLNFHPGTDWEYNPGHAVVGVLIEKISGQSLDRFLQKRILDPLGMADTCFYLPEEKVGRFAAAYTTEPNEWGNIGLIDSPETSAKVVGPKTYLSACGGLQSTAADYSRFAQMLLNGGKLDGTRIIGRKTLELMTANHTGDFLIYPMGPGYGYGLGFSVRTELAGASAPGSPGTFGWNGAFSTLFFVDPKEDLFGMFLTQVRDNMVLARLQKDFAALVYQALVD